MKLSRDERKLIRHALLISSRDSYNNPRYSKRGRKVADVIIAKLGAMHMGLNDELLKR